MTEMETFGTLFNATTVRHQTDMKKLLLTICLLLAPAAGAEGYSPHWLERVEPESVGMDAAGLKDIDTVVEQTIAIGHTPGAVVAIGRGNKLCFLAGMPAKLPSRPPTVSVMVFPAVSQLRSVRANWPLR